MLFVITLVLVFLPVPLSALSLDITPAPQLTEAAADLFKNRRPISHIETCDTMMKEARELWREAYSAVDKADTIREQAYRAKDEAMEMKEDALGARLALEQVLMETLVEMKTHMQEVRSSFSTLTSRLEALEQEVTERLPVVSRKRVSGELIPADRVEQSSTYPSTSYLGPENAVDGNEGTQTHTNCEGDQWFRYRFSEEESVGQIKIINGKIAGPHINRLNGLRVSIMASETHRVACQPESLRVREGEGVVNQTYYISCNGAQGLGVEFLLQTSATNNCLEFREIEVYAA